jgi:tRNA-specific 2-thiouridylase
MATGHYAKLYYDANNKRYGIGVADDITKDQSYMLWMLGQDVLSRLLLPLGTVNKSELRESAQFAGLSSARSKDSTDICFIPDKDHAKWLEENGVSDLPFGTFIHADGRLLGTSKPIYNYTVGQRRGLGLAMDRSVYVVGVNAAYATVTVDYEEGLYKNSFKVRDLNFIGISGPDELTVPIYVKIRYKAKMQSCSVTFDGDICNVCGDAFKAVAPGQSAVFYDEDGHILFGGIICG